MKRFVSALLLFGLLAQSLAIAPAAHAAPPANDAFAETWSRTDAPVASGDAIRTWMWGPEAFTDGMFEPYLESPNMEREVQYFDKSRMEINDPAAPDDGLWYLTNGLLVTEMITARMQIGEDAFVQLDPAEVNVAGDPDDPTGPTYATFGWLLDTDAAEPGTLYTQRLDRDANVVEDPSLAERGVTAGELDDVTGHTIAAPFWTFMTSSGLVLENGQLNTSTLFQDPYFAVGRPITEAYWSVVQVAGTPQDVLMQCFERRCLTYTPGNEPAWQVEAGNVGLHYYAWRYQSGQQYVIEAVSAADGGTVSLGEASLDIPAGALEDDTLGSISIHHQSPDAPEGYVPVSPLYDITLAGAGLTDEVTLTLPFDADEIPDDVDVDDLVVGRWADGSWSLLSGSVDSDTSTVSVNTDVLSFWQVFSPASGDVDPPSPPPPPPPPPGPGPGPGPGPRPPTGPENLPPAIDLNGPQAAGTGFVATFVANDGPVRITSDALTITDPDDTVLVSATVTLTNRPDGSAEVLAANTAGTSISASYNASTGVLVLSGNASISQYQQVLRTVTYDNTAPIPSTATRTITFVVNDGTVNSNTATAQVTMVPNIAPVAQDEDVLALGGVAQQIILSASDEDSLSLTFEIVSGPDQGTLDPTTPDADCTADGDGVTCTATVTYTADFGYNGPDAFTFIANDGILDSEPGTVSISVASASLELSTIVADPDTLTADGTSTSTITVQLLDSSGVALTSSGGVVVLETTSGTLSAVTDNDDGTYTATLNAPTTAGSATISGTLNEQPLDDSATVSLVAGPAASIEISAGDGGSATVGTNHTIEALVTDQFGNPVEGHTVSWAVASGGGSVSVAQSDTNSEGIAAVIWTLGTVAGDQTAIATASGLNGSPLTFTVNATADAPAQLAIVTQPSATAQSGVVFAQQPVIQLQDQYGNPVALDGYEVTASIASGGGSLDGDTTVSTQEDGLAAFSDLAISGTVGERTLGFSTTGLTGVTSDSIDITAGPASSLVIHAGDGQTAVAGSAVSIAPAVIVTDASGNPVEGVSVTFAVESGGGSITGGSQTTGADGITTVGSWTLGTEAGENSLTASTDFDDVTFTATGIAGPAYSIAIESGDGGSETVGDTRDLEVLITDENGNPVANHTVTWTIDSGDGSLVDGPTSSTNADGIATITWTIGTTAGEQSVEAAAVDDGATPLVGSPVTFTLQANPGDPDATTSEVTADPTSLIVGSSEESTITVQLRDSYGNAVTAGGADVEIATTAGTLSAVTDNADGTYTATLTAHTTVGSATITATLDDDPLTDNATVDFVVGPLAAFVVEASTGGEIADQIVGESFTIQITAVDAYDNTVTSFAGTVDITSDGTLSAGGGTTAAFVDGVLASHSVTFSASGTVTITATNTGDAETGTSNDFYVDAPPTVTSTTPVDDAENLPTDTNLVITFSEPVTVSGNWLQAVCTLSGTLDVTAVTVTDTDDTSYTVDFGDFDAGESCTVTVFAAQVADQDGSEVLNLAADYVFTFTVDAAPDVSSTSPADAGTMTTANDNVIITFTEDVTLGAGWFSLDCDGTILGPAAASITGGPTVFTINFTNPLPPGTECEMTIVASAVSDQDTNDPPNTMEADHVFTFSVPLTAVDDSYGATGNIAIAINATNGVLANDPGTGAGSGISVGTVNGAGANVGIPVATTQGGQVQLNADGSFQYDPPAGFVGNDTFTYQITKGALTSNTATVTINVAEVSNALMWFVCAGCTSDNQGTLLDPFTSVGAFSTANTGATPAPQPGDLVYILSGTYGATNTLTLRDSQRAYGQTVAASTLYTPHANSVSAFAALIAGTAPTLSPTSGTVVTLASGNTLQGLAITTPGSGLGISGPAIGTTTINSVSITGTGQALDLDTGTLSGALSSVTSSGGTNNIVMTDVATTETFNLGSGSLSGATSDAFKIDGQNGSFSYSGTIANTSATGLAVNILDKTGGTVTLSGNINPSGGLPLANSRGISVTNSLGTVTFSGSQKKISSGASNGVNVTGGSATVEFTNGGLVVVTTTGNGFHATAGTVRVSGTTNTISSVGGIALNVNGATIGTGGLTFQSISANGGTNGIVLNSTGSTAGLTVTGTSSTAGSGGTIQNMSGDGISLTLVRNVSVDRMSITNNDGSGIFGDDVTNFSLINSSVTNNADTATGVEANLRFHELLGTASISNSTISGSSEDEVRITPSSGTLTNLTVSNSTFGPNSATTGGHGIAIIGTNTANATLTVTNTTFQGIRSTSVLMNMADTATGTLNVSSSFFRDIGVAVTMQTSFSADLTFSISGNTEIVRSISNAIQLVAGSTSTNASQIRGTISGNVIGNGTVDSGSRDMFGIGLDLRGDQDAIIEVTNNLVQNTDFEGIWVSSADFGTNAAQSGRLDLKLTGNTVGRPDDNSGFPVGLIRGTLVDVRHTTTTCLDMSGNTSDGIGGGEDFRVRQRDTAIFLMERLSDGDATPGELINDVALLEAFVAGQNAAGSTADATLVTGFTEAANGSCRTP